MRRSGGLVYQKTGEVAKGPDGNGKALTSLYHGGIYERWKEIGVEVVQVIPVDNPLADPFDLELLGEHRRSGVDLVLKGVEREEGERLGVIGTRDNHLAVREYSEGSSSIPTFPYGNTGIFSCTLNFIEEVASLEIPWHLARKRGEGGEWMWKFETFIFDIFPHAKSFKVVIGERRNCFSPLKTLSGREGLESVAKALMTFNS